MYTVKPSFKNGAGKERERLRAPLPVTILTRIQTQNTKHPAARPRVGGPLLVRSLQEHLRLRLRDAPAPAPGPGSVNFQESIGAEQTFSPIEGNLRNMHGTGIVPARSGDVDD